MNFKTKRNLVIVLDVLCWILLIFFACKTNTPALDIREVDWLF